LSLVLDFVVPGPLEQRTGGYLYDARMIEGLRRRGWTVRVHGLAGPFPDAGAEGRASLAAALAGLPDGSRVVIDGLAMGALPEPVRAHAARLSIVSLVHHPLADETGLDGATRDRMTRLEREALAPCAGVLVTSAFTASRVRTYGAAPDRVRVVPPGTEPAPPAIGPAPGEPPVLLCVGTVTPRKGQDVLVRALDRLRERPWTCLCAGGLDLAPDFADSVREHTREAGLSDRIRFLGECGPERLAELYHTSSLFVLPSHYEGYGMALTEALARGLPVVSTTGGAIPYTVPAEAGVLVAPGDAPAFAAAIAGLLDAPERLGGLAAAALRHAATLPGWDEAEETFERALLAREPAEA
jgi:glycosyltransferase involved in cell wall biosynthesis